MSQTQYTRSDGLAESSVNAERQSVVHRPAWSPAQIVILAVSVAMVVVGGVALARAGAVFRNVPLHRSQVLGLGFTSMSAAVVIAAGVLLALACGHPYTARSAAGGFGVLFIAFGLVVALATNAFSNMWNFTTADGVVLICLGAILLIGLVVSPVFGGSARTVTRHQHRVA